MVKLQWYNIVIFPILCKKHILFEVKVILVKVVKVKVVNSIDFGSVKLFLLLRQC